MSTIKGIDISQYQKDVDFKKVKASGIDFVIIRAGYGKYVKQKDPQFETHYKNAKAAGLDVGVYWYSYALGVEDAKLEAQACLSVIKGKKFEYPIYFDLEERNQFAKGRTFCDSLVKTFCGEIEKAGYFAGLYISRSPLQQYISTSVANEYALWIAEYASKCNYNGTYGMWQYSSTGMVSGISGNVDCDYCYVDYPTKIKNGGYNGYTKPPVISPPATVKMQSSYTSTPTAIRINWNKVSSAAGYRIYRYDASTKKWVKLGTIKDSATTTFRDSKSLVPGTKYQYKIKAYTKVNGTTVWGNASSTFTASTKAVPTVKMQSSYTATTHAIRINWNAVSGASGYRIYRYNTTTKKWNTLKTVSSKTTTYRDSRLVAGTAYKYKVKAYIRVSGLPVWGKASDTFTANTKD